MSTIKYFIEQTAQIESWLRQVQRTESWLRKVQENRDFILALTDPTPGTLDGDLFIIYRTRSSEREKLEAAKRIVQAHFKRPIAWQRYNAHSKQFDQEISCRAESAGLSTKAIIRQCTRDALMIVIYEIAGHNSLFAKDCFDLIRRELNEELTEDLLGSGWRRKLNKKLSQPKWRQSLENCNLTTADGIEKVESEIHLEQMLQHAGLNEKDRYLLWGIALGFSIKQTADLLHLEAGTARQRVKRARKIIKEQYQ